MIITDKEGFDSADNHECSSTVIPQIGEVVCDDLKNLCEYDSGDVFPLEESDDGAEKLVNGKDWKKFCRLGFEHCEDDYCFSEEDDSRGARHLEEEWDNCDCLGWKPVFGDKGTLIYRKTTTKRTSKRAT